MHKLTARRPFSLVSLSASIVAMLAVGYIGLIAVVMNYAALTVSSSQSVKNDEAAVALLEGQYLDSLAAIERVDPLAAGYATPLTTQYVRAASATALR